MAATEPADDQPRERVTPRRPKQGRVIRVKRAQVDANLIDATAEDVTNAQQPAPSTTPTPPAISSLSDDDEADLIAELAAVEAELLASSAETADDGGTEDETPEEDVLDTAPPADQPTTDPEIIADVSASVRPARDILTSSDSSRDGDLSRLMAAADHRLSDEDATTSRETYNQLRAAVAAAQADSNGSDDARREARTRAFRDDLASVVRPRRPVAEAGGTAAEQMRAKARSAPLKLVAEQRIDPAAKLAPPRSPRQRPRTPARP